jgi:molybdopterin/thiamine biosynthesis adenylyltransferase
MDRHSRQRRLSEVGDAGQARIARACVDVPFEGLAGAVAVRYLAGAGVGALRVRSERLASEARALDPGVRVEVLTADVDAGEAVDVAPLVGGLRDPAARELGRGAYSALRALRAAIGVGPCP